MQFQKAVRPLRGEISVPGDKSISHRAVMFGAISEGTTEVTNFLQGADCLSTISCFRSMGIEIKNTPERILVHGKGLHGLSAPSAVLDCGNSGTTTRLISGILAGQNFSSTLTGDASIQKRPMGRIINPRWELPSAVFRKTAVRRLQSTAIRSTPSPIFRRSHPHRSNRVSCLPDCMLTEKQALPNRLFPETIRS